MAVKRELLLIIGLLLIIVVLVKAIEFFQLNVVEADASKFVVEDLRNKYPTADIAVMSIVDKYNERGGKYFEVKAKVTQNADGPCPKRSHIYYNYPVQNFVPQPPEVITNNCVVCTEGICTVAFSEEAIIASHTFSGTEDIQSYLSANPNAVPTVTEKLETDSWLVKWDSTTAAYYYLVEIHRDGRVLSVKKLEKS